MFACVEKYVQNKSLYTLPHMECIKPSPVNGAGVGGQSGERSGPT